MRDSIRLISKLIGMMVPSRSLFSRKTPVFLPFYHLVSDEKMPFHLNYPYRNIRQFEEELDLILKFFTPVSLNDLVNNPYPEKKVFHLSFDDGFRSCKEVIAPVLGKKGIPATFFVNTGFVDNKSLFHRIKAGLIYEKFKNTKNKEAEEIMREHRLAGERLLQADILQNDILDQIAAILDIDFDTFLKDFKPYMDLQDLKELEKTGFSIGAHSCNHAEFWKLNEKEQTEQVRESMNWVTGNLNTPIKAFSFPFTDDRISKRLFNIIKEEGICDITFGTAGLKYDEMDNHFQRYPAEQKGDFKSNIKAEWIYYFLRKKAGKNTVKH